MKILVPFKSVPDPNDATVAGAAISTPKSVINPFDEIAIEEALRIRERGEATEIVGATIGAPAVDEQIRAALLAGLLGWPQATFVSKIEFLDNKTHARCTRETDAGLEVVEVNLPAIITTDLRLNEPRYVSLPGLIRARRKPVEVLTCDQLGVTVRPLTTVLSIARPPKRAAGTRVESVEELITKLKQEAKVL